MSSSIGSSVDYCGFGRGLGRISLCRVLGSRGIRTSRLVRRPVSREVSTGMSVYSGGSYAIKSAGPIS